jgi:hypothetical protein
MDHPPPVIASLHDFSALLRTTLGYDRRVGPTPTDSNRSTPSAPRVPRPELDEAEPNEELRIPDINPFLQQAKTTTEDYKERWPDEDFIKAAIQAREEDLANERKADSGGDHWLTASTTHFGDRNYSAHLDADWKRMVEIKIFRYGYLDFEELQKLIGVLPKDFVNGSNTKPIMEMLKRRASSAKSETKMFLLLSLTHLVELVPEFATTTDKQRKRLLLRLFKKAKCVISRNLLHTENFSVDLANIFRSNDDRRRPWQILVKTKFVNLAIKMYHTIIANGDTKKQRQAWSEYYDNHMKSFDSAKVNIGGEGAVPTRAHRSITGHGRDGAQIRTGDFDIIDEDESELEDEN